MLVADGQLHDAKTDTATSFHDFTEPGELQSHDDIHFIVEKFGYHSLPPTRSFAAYYIGCVSSLQDLCGQPKQGKLCELMGEPVRSFPTQYLIIPLLSSMPPLHQASRSSENIIRQQSETCNLSGGIA